MLDGQRQRVDIPAHARITHKGLPQKRMKGGLCWIDHHVPPTTQSVKELDWPELNWTDFIEVFIDLKKRTLQTN